MTASADLVASLEAVIPLLREELKAKDRELIAAGRSADQNAFVEALAGYFWLEGHTAALEWLLEALAAGSPILGSHSHRARPTTSEARRYLAHCRKACRGDG